MGGGSWSQIQAEGATTRTLSGKSSNTYGYRVRACNAAGCGPYSSVASIVVLRIPGTPGLTVPATSTSGEYSVSWNGVTDATRYVLNRNSAGGGWSQVYSGASTSFAESGRSIGSWGYQVQACNASGCSAWSSTATVTVQASPLATPAGLTVKQQTRALCRVSWGSVSGATYYELMEAGGLAQSGNVLSYTLDATCQNPYKVRACNASTCSTWSSEVSG